MEPIQRPQDLQYQLMDFRTSYLRAVARATVDLDFRKLLTGGSINPLVILKDYFGYECPWDLTLVLKDDSELAPRMNIANGTVMTQPFRGESLIIYIPDKPKRPDGKDAPPVVVMEALAAYYDLTPFLLPDRAGRADQGKPKYEPVDDHPPPRWFSVNMFPDTTTRFDLGVAVDQFISFAAAMFNAVALAWDNTRFKDLLTKHSPPQLGDQPHPAKQGDHPLAGTSVEPPSEESAIGLLRTWLGYKYPWMMNLRVMIDENAEFTPVTDPTADNQGKGKWKIKAPQLTLTLPWMTGASSAKQETELNQKDTHVAIMGVTLYNTDGPGYPFTCG